MWWVLILGASIGGILGAIGTVIFIVYGSKWVKGGGKTEPLDDDSSPSDTIKKGK